MFHVLENLDDYTSNASSRRQQMDVGGSLGGARSNLRSLLKAKKDSAAENSKLATVDEDDELQIEELDADGNAKSSTQGSPFMEIDDLDDDITDADELRARERKMTKERKLLLSSTKTTDEDSGNSEESDSEDSSDGEEIDMRKVDQEVFSIQKKREEEKKKKDGVDVEEIEISEPDSEEEYMELLPAEKPLPAPREKQAKMLLPFTKQAKPGVPARDLPGRAPPMPKDVSGQPPIKRILFTQYASKD